MILAYTYTFIIFATYADFAVKRIPQIASLITFLRAKFKLFRWYILILLNFFFCFFLLFQSFPNI